MREHGRIFPHFQFAFCTGNVLSAFEEILSQYVVEDLLLKINYRFYLKTNQSINQFLASLGVECL